MSLGTRGIEDLQNWKATLERFGCEARLEHAQGPGCVSFEGHSVPDLIDEFGSPLVVFLERQARERFEAILSVFMAVHARRPPILRASSRVALETPKVTSGRRGAAQTLRPPAALAPLVAPLPDLYTTISSHPRQALLKMLSDWNVGLVAQCPMELRRIEAAHIPGHHVIYSTPCKSWEDISRAQQLGVQAIEVESLAELMELAHRASDDAPIPICLRLAPVTKLDLPGLVPDDAVKALRVISGVPALKLVGLAAGLAPRREVSVAVFQLLVEAVSSLAQDAVSRGEPLEFILLGLRPPPLAPGQSFQELISPFAEVLSAQSPLLGSHKIALLIEDLLVTHSCHTVGRVVWAESLLSPSGRRCVIDIPLPVLPPGPWRFLPAAWPAARDLEPGLVFHDFHFRFDVNHLTGHGEKLGLPFKCPEGFPVLLPKEALDRVTLLSLGGSVPRPTEILLRVDGTVEVIKTRDTLEQVISGES